MRIVFIPLTDLKLFPALHRVAADLARRDANVHVLSSQLPPVNGVDTRYIHWTRLPKPEGYAARLPWLRSNGPLIVRLLRDLRPDWVLAEQDYLVPALAYRLAFGHWTRIAAYFADYHGDRRYVRALKPFAGFIDAYVEVCDMRLAWRRRDWPRLKAPTFVIHHSAPLRADAVHEPHVGPARIVFTGSPGLLQKMSHERLSRFVMRLCERGISVDWYMPGSDDARAAARALLSHPLYAVHDPIAKPELMRTLGGYDAGLFWAPMADADLTRPWDRSVFVSAASNKVGEYLAAGLVVAHAGNPGLAYLPGDVAAVFDPTDPVAGADQLADALADRAEVERRRAASLRFHQETMNFEAQAEPFIRHLLADEPGRTG